MAKIIAFVNQKGGVGGKTTFAVNFSVGCAMRGKKVLALDSDPQADLTTSLGWKDSDNLSVTLATFMQHSIQNKPISLHSGILKHFEGIDLLPCNIELAAMEMELVKARDREFVLRSCLSNIGSQYDYVFIDCPPSLSMLTINALAAADSIVIPVQAQYLPAKGMTQLLNTVMRVRYSINPDLAIEGAALTLYDARESLAQETENLLRRQFGSVLKIFNTKIPRATQAAQASYFGQSIFTYAPKTKIAQAYDELIDEVLTNEQKDV